MDWDWQFIAIIVAVLALLAAIWRLSWMARQMRLSSAIAITNWLEAVREERHILYALKGKPYSDWDKEAREAAKRVTRQFDILGLLDSLGYTDLRFVDRFYANPAIEIWDICKPWVEEQRASRGPQHLWEFEQLALRVQKVWENHPARLTQPGWIRNPRGLSFRARILRYLRTRF